MHRDPGLGRPRRGRDALLRHHPVAAGGLGFARRAVARALPLIAPDTWLERSARHSAEPHAMEGQPPSRPLGRRFQRRVERKGLRPRYAASVIVVFWALGVVVFGVVERLVDPDTFDNVWLGMWWAIQTVTTVGYGDVVPGSTVGKVIASFMMLGGLSLFAVVTGAITSAFVAAGPKTDARGPGDREARRGDRPARGAEGRPRESGSRRRLTSSTQSAFPEPQRLGSARMAGADGSIERIPSRSSGAGSFPCCWCSPAIVGVVTSAVAWGFLELIYQIQQGVYTHLPTELGFDEHPEWWPLPVLAIAGVITAIAIVRLPGNGGHIPAEGLNPAPTQPIELPGVILAALASIGLGAVVGPEAPLIALGGGLGFLAFSLVRRDGPPQIGSCWRPPQPSRRSRSCSARR